MHTRKETLWRKRECLRLDITKEQLDKLFEVALAFSAATGGHYGYAELSNFLYNWNLSDIQLHIDTRSQLKGDIMKLLPQEVALTKELQQEFNRRYELVLIRAIEICQERAPLYDTTEPVWRRVEWPGGFLHEVRKKHGRIANIFEAEDASERWPSAREEAIDMINYLAFLVAFGDMLAEAEAGAEEEETQ